MQAPCPHPNKLKDILQSGRVPKILKPPNAGHYLTHSLVTHRGPRITVPCSLQLVFALRPKFYKQLYHRAYSFCAYKFKLIYTEEINTMRGAYYFMSK